MSSLEFASWFENNVKMVDFLIADFLIAGHITCTCKYQNSSEAVQIVALFSKNYSY